MAANEPIKVNVSTTPLPANKFDKLPSLRMTMHQLTDVILHGDCQNDCQPPAKKNKVDC